MVIQTRHEAGVHTAQQYRLSLNLIRAGLDEPRSSLITRFIEFWCQKNCLGDWRIEETTCTLTVWFDLARDIVLFKISDEYDYFAANTSSNAYRGVAISHFVSCQSITPMM